MAKQDLKMFPSGTPKTPPQNIPKNSSPHPRESAERSGTQPTKTMYLSNNGISTALSIKGVLGRENLIFEEKCRKGVPK